MSFALLNILVIELNFFDLDFILKDRGEWKNKFVDERFLWLFVLIGIIMEISLMILNFAKVRWYLISFCTLIINILIITKLVSIDGFDKKFYYGGSAIALGSLSSFSLVFMSYFEERIKKKVFINWFRNKENLSSFEYLIENVFQNQIIITKSSSLDIVYINSKSKEFYEVNEGFKCLDEKLKKIKIIKDSSHVIEMNLFELISEFIKRGFSDSSYLKFDGIYEKEEDKIFNFLIYIGPIDWKNEKAIFIVLMDISSITSLKSLKEINEYKDGLLATVSHDLRSPLNAIMGFLELLYSQIKEEQFLEEIKSAYNSAKLLLFLVNDILDYSQIMKKKLKLNKEKFTLQQVISDLDSVLQLQFDKKDLIFEKNIDDNLLTHDINGDIYRIEQILLNLIGNSLKFTEEGKVSLNIYIEECDFHNLEHKKIVFKVIDTGIGIKSEQIPEIFQLFKKIENPYKNRSGIGLGLPISQNLAVLMHEEGIQVKSVVTKGSEFSFSIPLDGINELIEKEPSKNLMNYEDYSSKANKVNFKNCPTINILVVDDDIMNLMIHKKFLASLGLQADDHCVNS